MNTGAQNATGEIFIFLHADTFLPDNALTDIKQVISSTKKGRGRFDISLNGTSAMLKVISLLMNIRSRLTGIATGDQVIFISNNLFNEVNGYTEIALMKDINLSARLNKLYKPYCLRSKVISSDGRWEQVGLVRTILLMWCLRLRYFFGESPETLSILYRRGLFWKP